MENKMNPFIYWIPRALSILFIAFIAILSLDVIDSDSSLSKNIFNLLIQNISTIVLIAALIVSWKYEIVGAAAFIIAGLLYIIMETGSVVWRLALVRSFIISGPAVLVGVLFWINWIKKKRKKAEK